MTPPRSPHTSGWHHPDTLYKMMGNLTLEDAVVETVEGGVVIHATERLQVRQALTHLPLDKKAAVLGGDIFKCIFLNGNDRIQIQISLKFIPRGTIDNKPALFQVMAWRRIGDKPLPEIMMTQFTDAYMRH